MAEELLWLREPIYKELVEPYRELLATHGGKYFDSPAGILPGVKVVQLFPFALWLNAKRAMPLYTCAPKHSCPGDLDTERGWISPLPIRKCAGAEWLYEDGEWDSCFKLYYCRYSADMAFPFQIQFMDRYTFSVYRMQRVSVPGMLPIIQLDHAWALFFRELVTKRNFPVLDCKKPFCF